MTSKDDMRRGADGDLPASLREISSLLDALGRADGASAPSGMEPRIEASFRASLQDGASVPEWLDSALGELGSADRDGAPGGLEARIAASTARVLAEGASPAELAEADRLSVSAGLEDRVFVATRETILSASDRPRLRLAGAGSLVAAAGRYRLAHLSAAAAAALLIATGGVLFWRASNVAPMDSDPFGPVAVVPDGGVPVAPPVASVPRVRTVAALDPVEPDWVWLRESLGPLAQASTGVAWDDSFESSLEEDDWCVACELFEAEEGFAG